MLDKGYYPIGTWVRIAPGKLGYIGNNSEGVFKTIQSRHHNNRSAIFVEGYGEWYCYDPDVILVYPDFTKWWE